MSRIGCFCCQVLKSGWTKTKEECCWGPPQVKGLIGGLGDAAPWIVQHILIVDVKDEECRSRQSWGKLRVAEAQRKTFKHKEESYRSRDSIVLSRLWFVCTWRKPPCVHAAGSESVCEWCFLSPARLLLLVVSPRGCVTGEEGCGSGAEWTCSY